MKRTLYLVDAYSQIYRAYHALAATRTYEAGGIDTTAIFGFFNLFAELYEKALQEYMVVVFDPPGPTFRHQMDESYKANRQKTPEAIRQAVPIIKQMLQLMGVSLCEVEGYEADDVIGTLATNYSNHPNLLVRMVTSDKDYGQLVNNNVVVYNKDPNKRAAGYEEQDANYYTQKFGLQNTQQVKDYLALIGDASDNVKGCPGIGKATAAKLLQDYTSIQDIYNNIDSITGKKAENLKTYKEQVLKSLEMVTICTNVPVTMDLTNAQITPAKADELYQFIKEYQLSNLEKRLKKIGVLPNNIQQETGFLGSLFGQEEGSHQQTSIQVTINSTLINSAEELQNYLQAVCASATQQLSLAVILDGNNPHYSELLGISLAYGTNESAAYLPATVPNWVQVLTPFLQRQQEGTANITWVAHNLKHTQHALRNYGIHLAPPYYDTLLAHYVYDPEGRHTLSAIAHTMLSGYTATNLEDIKKQYGLKKKDSLSTLSPAKLQQYAAEQALLPLNIYHYFQDNKLLDSTLQTLYEEVELPLMQVLTNMEQTGVNVDLPVLKEVSGHLHQQMQNIQQQVYTLAGKNFNINSTAELGEVLYDDLAITQKPPKTATGRYSTREEELLKFKDEHPIIPLILQYRSLRKLLSTYVDTLPTYIHPHTGRIHTTFNQAVTATGRLSSTEPNLQNIPVREEEGREIRKAFVPLNPNELFVSADYSQIELRLMAHFSQDESLLLAFNQEKDVHTDTAAKIFGVEPEQVTPEQRRQAKMANFGIIYGITPYGLASRLDIPYGQAAQLMKGYFDSYPAVKQYMNASIEQARKKGYAETLLGRRRNLSHINDANQNEREYTERIAINTPIQGTAADLIKLAMIRIQKQIKANNLRSKMLMQVHDELNFSVPQEELQQITQIIRHEMENVCPQITVPLTVDIGVGDNWLQAH